MKQVLQLLTMIGIVNIIIFLVNKTTGFLAPKLSRLLFKHDISSLLKHPEIQEKAKVRDRFIHYSWTAWLVFIYAILPLSGVYYWLALLGGLLVSLVARRETSAIAAIEAKYREKDFLEAQSQVDSFFSELHKQIADAQDKGAPKN